ncbi:MAG: D-tyrosyl-tRNA(Tyr) deacylase [Candidatus Melainabacteria bacterium GWF2_37_15]|nr:MAG: D-tyrosyl-tRNA(Tyr) deacylase [Candidatus Melainabacteria bacterium GWF2_37_15]
MIAVIQRVKQASVTIDNELYSRIDKGILVLLGVEKEDTEEQAKFLADKIVNLRIFEDDAGKMNLSLADVNGEMLVVSQFTLAGDCKKGKRPGFDNAARPELAIPLYEKFIEFVKKQGIPVKTGQFGAMMDVGLINDGPVTFILRK